MGLSSPNAASPGPSNQAKSENIAAQTNGNNNNQNRAPPGPGSGMSNE